MRFLDAGRLAAVLPRYSTIALICFVVVASSGYLSAAIRVGELSRLLTPYGVLVLAKVAVLSCSGCSARYQRRRLSAGSRQPGGEACSGLLVLRSSRSWASRRASPRPSPARRLRSSRSRPRPRPPRLPPRYLTGKPLPPELTPDRFLTEWNVDLLWLLVCALRGVLLPRRGVRRLRRRGDRWPWYRTALWVAGMAVLFWVTNGALNVYEQFLFSTHMLGHMILTMAIPVLLVLSAPVTLGLRPIVKRD